VSWESFIYTLLSLIPKLDWNGKQISAAKVIEMGT